MNKLARLAAIVTLVFGASTASAIPLQVNVETLSVGGSAGSWSLTGNTPDSGSWLHLFADDSTWNIDILPGSYTWNITGGSLGVVGLVSWSLNLAGQEIFSNSESGWWFFEFGDNLEFRASPVSVPEPGTLALFGTALSLLGLARSRRRLRA